MATSTIRRIPTVSLPLYLAPAFAESSSSTFHSSSRLFSSTPCSHAHPVRSNRDKNKERGVSAIRSTGPRKPLYSIQKAIKERGLPQPVLNSERLKEFKTKPDHGLWGFFNEEKLALLSPEEEGAHGRPPSLSESMHHLLMPGRTSMDLRRAFG